MNKNLLKLCLGIALLVPVATASAHDRWDDREERWDYRDDRGRYYDREWDRDRYDRDYYRPNWYGSSYHGNNTRARPCPFSCASEGIPKVNCKDWREGNTCFVQVVPYNDHPSARSAGRR